MSWWTDGLPPYDPAASCRKCGNAAISVKHTKLALDAGDVLRRTCVRCCFVWDEKPLDAEAKP